MKQLLIVIVVLLTTSCSQKYFAKQCTKRFPIVETTKEVIKYIPGETDSFITTVTLDCDSAMKAVKNDTTRNLGTKNPYVFQVPCPPSTHRVDTFMSYTETIRKDSAGNYLTQLTISKLTIENKSQKDKIIEQRKKIWNLGLFVSGFCVLLIGTIIVKLYLKFKP